MSKRFLDTLMAIVIIGSAFLLTLWALLKVMTDNVSH
jgi:hypothetical protein